MKYRIMRYLGPGQLPLHRPTTPTTAAPPRPRTGAPTPRAAPFSPPHRTQHRGIEYRAMRHLGLGQRTLHRPTAPTTAAYAAA